ncbi:ECF transporter S component [Clostridium tetanomorphum]|uniref:ECF transporter S component n=2 Tax=Clostridium tetanomorphum TaxID=1553 RepID=A0A923E8C9_CLOTT|nr:ECF transporter S component [Clostridium tetanomorphum]MBC2396949.1 ECF transporter S component [Clostridium tetanomorphum]
MAIIGMLSAISILLGVSGLGFIPIPPVKATIMHIPVIIGSILEGPVVGGMIGLIFGLFSVIQAMTNPTPLFFVFINPVVSVLPRILIGIVSYYCYNMIRGKHTSIKIGIGAAIGSLTNTFGVLGLMYLLYVERYAKVFNISVSAAKKGIIAIGFTNGLPEAAISVLITIPVVIAVKKLKK